MIIALQKKKENIVEYLLYMFNIEGMIRTLNFDLKEIEPALIAQYDVDEQKAEEIKNGTPTLLLKCELLAFKKKDT